MEPAGIDGAWVFTPRIFHDARGHFLECFRAGELSAALGYRPGVAQANCSVSRRGVIRGIHFADVPPGQAKYVCCVSGAILDVIVDVRVGSPSYGRWAAVRLDDAGRHAVFLSEGLGHAFMALSDQATVIYLCSTAYAPDREHGVHPLDRATRPPTGRPRRVTGRTNGRNSLSGAAEAAISANARRRERRQSPNASR